MKTFQRFLREVSEEDIGRVGLDRDLHFDSIFGDRLRIAFPLDQDESLKRMIGELERLGYEVDFGDLVRDKTVNKRVQTRQGEKLRPEKVGKVLQAAGLKDLLDWWQKNSEGIGRSRVGSSIVISRSPIDLLRMSDHDGITSCHSPGGIFYKCARQEARTGGAVAYVVKNVDLKGVDLQDDEIFEDRDRRVKGIVPLERLRLRRFTKGDLELLVPDTKTYGVQTVGFLDAVSRWARKTQEKTMSKIDPVADYSKFSLRGGSYQDVGHETDRTWSNFFGVSVSGRKTSRDTEDEDEDENGDMYEQAEETLRQHQARWDHFSADVNEEEGILFYHGYGEVKIPSRLLSGKEVFDALYAGRTRTYSPSSEEAAKPAGKVFEHVKKVVFDVVKDEVEGFDKDNLEIRYDGEDFTFSFSFRGREDGSGYLNEFERFLDEIDGLDRNYDDMVERVRVALLNAGYIKHVADKLSFKHFEVEEGDESTDFELMSSSPERVGHIKDFRIHRHHFKYDSSGKVTFSGWDNQFAAYINRYKALPIPVDDRIVNLSMVFHDTSGVDKQDWQGTPGGEWKDEDVASITGWVYLEFENIYLKAEADPNFIARIKYLDDNWDFYMKKIYLLFEKFVQDLRRVEQWKQGREIYAGGAQKGPDASTVGFGNMLAPDRPEAGIEPITGPVARNLKKKPNIRDPQMRLGLKFKEWLYGAL
jgi:hypothetical protein